MKDNEIDILLTELQTGKEDSFRPLYEKTFRGLFSYIYMMIKDYQTSEDLLQMTYLKIKQNIVTYKPKTNARAWLIQIAKNLTIDYIRKVSKTPCVELEENMAEESFNFEKKFYLLNLLSTILTLEERQILILKVEFGYKFKEIAQQKNMPLGTVLWKYSNAIKTLKEKIEEDEKCVKSK